MSLVEFGKPIDVHLWAVELCVLDFGMYSGVCSDVWGQYYPVQSNLWAIEMCVLDFGMTFCVCNDVWGQFNSV